MLPVGREGGKCYQWGGKEEGQDMGRGLKGANYYVYNK